MILRYVYKLARLRFPARTARGVEAGPAPVRCSPADTGAETEWKRTLRKAMP